MSGLHAEAPRTPICKGHALLELSRCGNIGLPERVGRASACTDPGRTGYRWGNPETPVVQSHNNTRKFNWLLLFCAPLFFGIISLPLSLPLSWKLKLEDIFPSRFHSFLLSGMVDTKAFDSDLCFYLTQKQDVKLILLAILRCLPRQYDHQTGCLGNRTASWNA